MGTMISILLPWTLGITVSACLLLLAGKLIANRYPARVEYYAWLFLVIAMLLPGRLLPENAVSNKLWKRIPVLSSEFSDLFQIKQAFGGIEEAGDKTQWQESTNLTLEKNAVSDTLEKAEVGREIWEKILNLLGGLWIGGAVTCFLYQVLRHRKMIRTVKRWSSSKQQLYLDTLLESICDTKRRRPNYRLCSCIEAPFITGIFRGTIYLPSRWFPAEEMKTSDSFLLDRKEYQFILQHELVHWKRKDLMIKLLLLIAGSIHWMNPIMYFVKRRITLVCEISCDESVLQGQDIETRYHYVQTLLLLCSHSETKTALSTAFYGGKKDMKKRISAILGTCRRKTGFIFGFLAFIGIFGSSVVFGAWGKEKTELLDGYTFTTQEQGENSTELFQPYIKYGLEYDKATGELYYQGKKVRQFSDLYSIEDFGEAGVYHLKETGEIDVYAVRDFSEIKYNKDGSFDPSGHLTGLRIAGEEEFETVTKEIRQQASASMAQTSINHLGEEGLLTGSIDEATSVEAASGNLPFKLLAAEYKEYEAFGLLYNEKEDQFYYQGERVRKLLDILKSNGEELESGKFKGAMRSIWKDGGTVDVYTKRDKNGTLTAVMAYSEEEFKAHTNQSGAVLFETVQPETVPSKASENYVK